MGVRDAHPAVNGLSLLEDLLTDPVTPTNLRRRTASFLFAQNAFDLRFPEPALPDVRLLEFGGPSLKPKHQEAGRSRGNAEGWVGAG